MIIHNINPVLAKLGPFEIRYYGLVYIVGFIVCYFVLRHLAKVSEKKNHYALKITKDEVYDFVFYIILGVVIGSRLFEVIVWNPVYYFHHPLKIFAVWEGGMAFHGGLIGVVIAGIYFAKKKKIGFGKIADVLVVPAVFVLALGRITNFINGELVGTLADPARIPWCVDFSLISGIEGCRHPVQLYGAIGRFALFGFLLFLYFKSINKESRFYKLKYGFLLWSFIFLVGVGRFFCDFFRVDPRYLGLSMGQYLSLILVVVAVVVFIRYYRKSFRRIFRIT